MKKITSILLITILIITMSINAFATESEQISDNLKHELTLKQTGSMEVTEEQQRAFDKEIDEAYNRVMAEETYIVNFINSFPIKEETDIENWEFNLAYLQENYDKIKKNSEKKNSDIRMDYVDSYIGAYEVVKMNVQAPNEKAYVPDFTRTADSNYDINDAVNYAETYYNNYNSAYPDWTYDGGDCANFVSQTLYAGGKQMEGTPGSSSEAEYFGNWFSSGSSESTTNVSSTWRGADAFRNYWQDHSLSYKTFSSYTSETYSYGFRGDAVSLLTSTSRAYHTLIIVGYSDGLIYSAHTGNTFTGKLKYQSNFKIYSMSVGQE